MAFFVNNCVNVALILPSALSSIHEEKPMKFEDKDLMFSLATVKKRIDQHVEWVIDQIGELNDPLLDIMNDLMKYDNRLVSYAKQAYERAQQIDDQILSHISLLMEYVDIISFGVRNISKK
jgi:hypothetical protein